MYNKDRNREGEETKIMQCRCEKERTREYYPPRVPFLGEMYPTVGSYGELCIIETETEKETMITQGSLAKEKYKRVLSSKSSFSR